MQVTLGNIKLALMVERLIGRSKLKAQTYICIRADLVGSRRTGEASRLPEIAAVLNCKANADALLPFTLRAGDELFAVYEDLKAGYRAFRCLHDQAKAAQIGFYVGLGIGGIESANRGEAERINGPAIWRASDALEELRQKPDSEVLKAIAKVKFHYNIHASDNRSLNLAVVTYLHFIMQRIEARTLQQSQAIQLLEEHPDWNNAQLYWTVSGTDESQVPAAYATANFSKLLARADYHFVREAEESLITLLQSLSEREEE